MPVARRQAKSRQDKIVHYEYGYLKGSHKKETGISHFNNLGYRVSKVRTRWIFVVPTMSDPDKERVNIFSECALLT